MLLLFFHFNSLSVHLCIYQSICTRACLTFFFFCFFSSEHFYVFVYYSVDGWRIQSTEQRHTFSSFNTLKVHFFSLALVHAHIQNVCVYTYTSVRVYVCVRVYRRRNFDSSTLCAGPCVLVLISMRMVEEAKEKFKNKSGVKWLTTLTYIYDPIYAREWKKKVVVWYIFFLFIISYVELTFIT